MKTILTGVMLVVLFASGAFAGDGKWEIKQSNPYSNNNTSSYSYGSTDIEMKKKYDTDPSNKYRGTLENDGTVRMRDYNGNTLRGTIDNDGYGRLRDQDGNTIRVKPR